jgi:ribose transport system substrate-binding protein
MHLINSNHGGEHMKRLLIFVLLVLFIFSSTTVFAQKKTRIGVSLPAADNPFFVRMREGVEEAAKKYNVEARIFLAGENQAKQLSDCEDLIQSKVDVLVFVPVDTQAAVPIVELAVAAGIPVVDLNRRVQSDKYMVRIGSDDVQVGVRIGEFLAKKLNGKGDLVMLRGKAGASVANQREEGLLSVITKYPGIKVLSKMANEHQRAEGMRIMEDLLQTHPKIDAVYCINDEVALGAVGAIEAAKRKGILVTGIDANKDGIEAVRQGRMALTVAQRPRLMGKLGIEYALKIINGEKIPKEVVTDIVVITPDNINSVDLSGN